MGSVGVQTGGGRITAEQVRQLSDSSQALREQFNEASSLVVYPNNYTSYESIQDSVKKWADRLGMGSASRGYAFAMDSATNEQKQSLLNAINSSNNLPQNSDSSYQARVDKMIARAQSWAKSNGRSGLTSIEKRAISEIVRSTYQREQMDKIIARDIKNGNKLFGGNIRTRNLRKSDFT